MSNRREQERQHRRAMLLEAAGRVFGRKPFFEATMQDVASEAEIGMQGLYEHFPSKQELYEQVMQTRAEAFLERSQKALAQAGGGPLERIRVLAQVYAESFQDRPFSLPMFIQDRVQFDWDFDSRFRSRLGEIYRAERACLRSLIQEALDLGLLRPLDPDFLTQLALDVLQASLHYSHRHGSGETTAACVARALDCLLRGVGREGDPS
jgi:AcrR family transcriptional regulator